jgi:hypothetical protein
MRLVEAIRRPGVRVLFRQWQTDPLGALGGLRAVGSSNLQKLDSGCTCLVYQDGLGAPTGRVRRDPACPTHHSHPKGDA